MNYQAYDPEVEVENLPDFVTVPLRRGIFEIREILNIVNQCGGVICGGYVRYCASPKKNPHPAQDLDIYSANEEVYKKLRGVFDYYPIKFENNMAISFHSDRYTPEIQVIKPVKEGSIVAVGDVEEILKNFDFSVVRGAIINENQALVDKYFMEDEEHNILRLMNIHCPISSTMRCVKYGKKGYWLKPSESLKLFLDWDARSHEYKANIIEGFEKSFKSLKGEGEMTREEVEELEALLRID